MIWRISIFTKSLEKNKTKIRQLNQSRRFKNQIQFKTLIWRFSILRGTFEIKNIF